MPRQARLDSPGTLHHVMIRGIEGRSIFFEDGDRENFLARMRDLSLNTGTRILAWAFMKNHVHLLLFSGGAGLPTFMRKLLTGYAVWFNRKHRRRGHLFQNRYKSIVCEENPYLLELVRYIHLNPLRSSAVQGLAELDRYRWCGHSAVVGRKDNDWQETGYILSLFGGGKRKAIGAYRRFIAEGKDIGRRPELVGGGLIRSLGGWSKVLSLRNRGQKEEYDSRFLGSGEFVQGILGEADEKLRRQIKHKKRENSIEEVIEKMCAEGGVKAEELRGGNQRRRVAKVRAKVSFRLNREMGISMAEIARQLGVGGTAVAMAIRKEERGKRF